MKRLAMGAVIACAMSFAALGAEQDGRAAKSETLARMAKTNLALQARMEVRDLRVRRSVGNICSGCGSRPLRSAETRQRP